EDPFGVLGHEAVRVMSVLPRRGVPTERRPELAGREREDLRLLLQPVNTGRIQFQLPAPGVMVTVGADGPRHVVVEELADPRGEVAGVVQYLRHTALERDRLPEDLPVGLDAGAGRIQPGKQRIPARTAEGVRTIRTLKPHAAGHELVDIRRLGERVAVTSEHI